MSMDLPSAPNPRGNVVPKFYSEELIEQEAIRLTRVIKQPERWTIEHCKTCLLYTSPSPRDQRGSRMPSSA